MKFKAQFGGFPASMPTSAGHEGAFRIAILGDFSGRAARGEMGIGNDLAARRAIRLDIDTLDDVIEGFKTTIVLPVGKDGAGIEIDLASIEDLHPDELYEKVELFDVLSSLRQQLERGATADAALKELSTWAEEFGTARLKPSGPSGAMTIPADGKLSDFKALIDRKPKAIAASDAEDLIERIVGPYVLAANDPAVDAAIEAVDQAISGAMRLILHHPDFQALEAQWRTLDLLARRIDGAGDLRVFVFDVSAEEVAADLAASDDLSKTGIYRLLSEPRLPDGDGAISAAFGLYTFEETPPHAELLGRLAQVAAKSTTAFVTSMSSHFFDVALKDRHSLVVDAWQQLRDLSAAQYLGLCSPRFLLRQPYGQKSDPIYEFEFEEFTRSEGLRGMLWGNPAAIAAILIAASKGSGGDLGDVSSIGDMPFYYTEDRHGDQVALPCTERNITESKLSTTTARGFIPVIGPRGHDEVRFGSFQSVSGQPLAGPWRAVDVELMSPKAPRSRESAPKLDTSVTAPASNPATEAPKPLSTETPPEAVPPEPRKLSKEPPPSAAAPADAPESDPAAEASGDADLDAELNALLAEYDTDSVSDSGGDEGAEDDLDAELAALLDDL